MNRRRHASNNIVSKFYLLRYDTLWQRACAPIETSIFIEAVGQGGSVLRKRGRGGGAE